MTFRNLQAHFINTVIWIGTNILCRIPKDAKAELDNFPAQGPMIAYMNHIQALEVPLIYVHLLPRPVSAMAKAESWDSRFFAWLFDLWRLVPVRRGEADLDAMRKSMAMIKDEGYIFGIAPEGTRTRDGKLQKAHPGIVPIALKTGAPLKAIAHWGAENFAENFKRFKRTDFHIRVGEDFYLDPHGERVNSKVRQEMVDEIMIVLARLMPEEYRGYYADKVEQELKYIRYA